MSYAVARMQKMKSGNLGGAYRHNERIFENHSNKDIDPEKTHLNYELTDRDRSIPYDRQIKQYINDNKISKRALRKDAVLCNEWIITSDKAFFENMSSDQIKDFFETAKNFFAERYGNSNIAYAMVHLDESTPHMHLGLVPMQNGKLSSKSLFGSRDQLKEIQEAFPKYLNEHGYNLQRGESDSKKKHLETAEFKEKQRLLDDTDKKIVDKTEKLKQLEKEKDALLDDIAVLESIQPLQLEEMKKEKLVRRTFDGKLKMDKATYDRLFNTASQHALDNNRLSHENSNLEQQLQQSLSKQNNLAKELMKSDHILSENRTLKSEVDKLEHANKKLNENMKRLSEQLNAVNKKLALWRKTARNYMHPKEFSKMLHVINQIRPPRITIMSVARSFKNMIEKNIF
ncbi:MobV family relaxase [Streptococcus oralis]|jgi:plasmid recombination enzyme|uniref:Plasmid recombination enzyme n=1 Tax=Streptococcus oralis TaxID=1303 RepID=A0A428I9C1_STROR|nr:MobV family relaxase [Streptococcus oralis]QPT01042.1 plasmid recombination protein [Streptococcus oralis]RSK09797.1 Plasmid recombination enzyme [Streptococcus oralis]CAK1608509.1 plasmid recombination enzyme [Streptococcus oralis subsp. dentisani]